MAEPAGELEDLSAPPRPMQRASPAALSMSARLALYVGVVAFTVSSVVQGLLVLWAVLVLALLAGAAEILVHTGGLDSATFATCSTAAAIIDGGVLLVVLIASAIRARRRTLGHMTSLHPVVATAMWMLCALGLVRAFGWQHSLYFPAPLATIVVLANAYFFALIGIALSLLLTAQAWRWVRAWSLASQFRTGFLTACLLLVAAESYWMITNRWYAPALEEAEARLAIVPAGAEAGLVTTQLIGLCLAANELEPALAESDTAPGCRFLAGH